MRLMAVATLSLFLALSITGAAGDARQEKIGPWHVEKAGMRAEWKIDADYPVLGVPGIDNVVKAWLTAHTAMIMDNTKDYADADITEMLLTVKIDYEVVGETPGAVSILFHTHYDDNRAAHPSHMTNSFVFSTKGEVLLLDSLFADPERALKIFSEQSPRLLKEHFGEEKEELYGRDEWIAQGTAPTLKNFGCYAVEPGGVRVYFKEYQIAPYAWGRPDILIPLAVLEPAGPSGEVWPAH